MSSTTRPADTNPCFGCQQGRLLLLLAGRCLRSSTGQAAVHPQHCPDSFSQPGAPNATVGNTPLLRDLHVGYRSRNGFSSVSAFWHSDVSMDERRYISLRAFVGQPMWKVVATSAHTTMTLVVPSVQRLTLGDRAFPVAASRAWNSLPPAIRTVSSFTWSCFACMVTRDYVE